MCQITLSMLVVGSTWHCFNLRNVFAGEPAFAYCGDKEAGVETHVCKVQLILRSIAELKVSLRPCKVDLLIC